MKSSKKLAGFVLHSLAAGLPFGFLALAQPGQIWIVIAFDLLIGVMLRAIWNAWGRTCLGIGLIVIAGALAGGVQTRVLFMQTSGNWGQVPSPGRTAVEFTYANNSIYCLRMASGDTLCCEPFPEPGIGACGPDTLTLEEKIEKDDFGRLIDNKNHFFLPKAPGEILATYHYYYAFFEGDGQTSYILADGGMVWRWNDFYNAYAMLFVIFAGFWGGLAGAGYYGVRSLVYNRWYRMQFSSSGKGRVTHQRDIHSPAYVRALFDEMSASYNLVNTISSFGFAMRWRKQCVARLSIPTDGVVHDWMTGMGECWPLLKPRLGQVGKLIAVDLSPGMLKAARARQQGSGGQEIEILEADVLAGTLPGDSADVVISSFGIKTFSEVQRAAFAAELKRVLKPGGAFSLIEISMPPNVFLRAPYRFYLNYVIPVIGRLFLGNPDHYRMLGVYAGLFWNCQLMARELRAVGLEVEEYTAFFGCATGLSGKKLREG